MRKPNPSRAELLRLQFRIEALEEKLARETKTLKQVVAQREAELWRADEYLTLVKALRSTLILSSDGTSRHLDDIDREYQEKKRVVLV
jgi:hypothetical protein